MNEKRGHDHGVNLSMLRALAKRLKTQHELHLHKAVAHGQPNIAVVAEGTVARSAAGMPSDGRLRRFGAQYLWEVEHSDERGFEERVH